jgi:putative transposase
LQPAAYRQLGRAFSVTIGTSPRAPVFEELRFGADCVELLRRVSSETDSKVYAFLLMPDHAHLLLGVGPVADLASVVGQWKSLCSHARRARHGTMRLWQRSFYDHAVRDDEDLRRAATYILDNPVRAGLVSNFHDYPLCGSFEFDL